MKMNSMNLNIINSPWPIMMTTNILIMSLNLIINMNKLIMKSMLLMIPIIMIFFLWMMNSMNEKLNSGMKNNFSELSMKPMIILIIMSEAMFFTSFFYINLSNLLFNNIMFNMKFFLNMFKLNMMLSFMNLMILLNSSMTFMMMLKNNKMNKSTKMLNYTLMLGMYFLMIQMMEYYMIPFNMSSSIFFSNFFMLTMFHMIHVMMGIMLMMMLKLMKKKTLLLINTKTKMLCWYWHFVDLIWMWIFLLIYL